VSTQLKQAAANLFVTFRVPTVFIPKGGQKFAAEIADQFTTFIEGVAEGYNEENHTGLSVEEGLQTFLDSATNFSDIFSQNLDKVELARRAINIQWGKQKGFKEAYKFLTPKFALWFIHKIYVIKYPELGAILIQHPKGEALMTDFVKALRQLIWNK
jgi:hypothetical protein